MKLEKILSDHLIPVDQILDSLAEGVCIAGRDFSFIYWNEAAKKILFDVPDDTPPEDWARRFGLYSLETGEMLAFDKLPMVMALREETYDDYRIISKNALNPEGYTLSVCGRPIRNGNATVAAITSFRNITTQSKLEKQLHTDRKFFESVLDLMPGIIFIKDLAGKFIYGNKGFREILGSKDVTGTNTENYLNQVQAKEIRSHDQLVLSTLRPQTFDEVIHWGNGTRSIFQTIRFPFFGPSHELAGVCAVGRDVTRETDDKLALDEERQRSVKMAKLATIGTLAGEIAHEIRNPLTAISGNAALISSLAREDNIDRNEIIAKVEALNQTIGRISDIVTSLSMFSRDTDRMKAHEFSVRELIENVRTALSIRPGFRKISFIVEYPSGDPGVFFGNMVQISQVVLNLAVNAFQEVEGRQRSWVKIISWSKPAELVFEVLDSGPGVPEDIREKIFEPYFTTRSESGTGLGLSISRKIAHQYGGDVTYISEGNAHRFRAVFRRDLSATGKDLSEDDSPRTH